MVNNKVQTSKCYTKYTMYVSSKEQFTSGTIKKLRFKRYSSALKLFCLSCF